MSADRKLVRGATEYISVTVISDVTLDAQPVEFSFDKTTWHTAAWQGSAGMTRTARFLLTPATTPTRTNNAIYVRVTDATETPIIRAGNLIVED